MHTLSSLLSALTESGKIRFEGDHYADGSAVYTGDLWRIWPDPSGLESAKQDRLRALMEKRKMQLRFDDETITDDDGKVHELNPGYYGEVATFKIVDCTVWSKANALESTSDYIEELLKVSFKSRADRWLSAEQFEEQGFKRFDYDAESGFHPGQTDTPESVIAKFEEATPGAYDYLFQIDDVGQFDCGFHLWYRPKE